jgi:hypothetical protein
MPETTPPPVSPASSAAQDRPSDETPIFRPRDQFWPYADLEEEPSDEELARLDPDLQAALFENPPGRYFSYTIVFENPPGRYFSYTIVFGPFQGDTYARAVALAKETSDYLETGHGDTLRHRARFRPDQVTALRDLWQLVGHLDGIDVLIDDRPLPFARELWLPLLWHLLPL